MRAPRTHEPAPEAWTTDFAAASAAAAHALHGERFADTAAWADLTLLWFRPPRYPGRYTFFAMEAAYARDIEARDPGHLAVLLGYSEKPQIVWHANRGNELRYRGVDRLVARGRRGWAAVGAWPWAAYRPTGRLPRQWRVDERSLTALRDWCSRVVRDAEWWVEVVAEELDRARRLLESDARQRQ
jgi:hypothetical protein